MMMDRIRALDDQIAAQDADAKVVVSGGLTGAEIKKKQKDFVKMLNLNDPSAMSHKDI